ncbi:MAG: hypothetical protein CL596_05485 [Alteromonas sp.]|nr:hypothetical protein [Alteromonas sp.]MAY23195.1 hypothetical protein [Flavobacteriaceae bacterium]|tara:strand:- start:97422 stop:97859 length:438 start_codon:yes stop_codon:yes gene_type:complete
MKFATLKNLILFVVFLGLTSCKTQDPEEQKENIAGYWEIERVTLPNGTHKEFTINTTIDFIEITENKGIRRKLAPKIDGTFEYFRDAENFEMVIENDSLHLYYRTAYASWKETVLEASEESLIVQNDDKKIYQYKKYQPLNFTNE